MVKLHAGVWGDQADEDTYATIKAGKFGMHHTLWNFAPCCTQMRLAPCAGWYTSRLGEALLGSRNLCAGRPPGWRSGLSLLQTPQNRQIPASCPNLETSLFGGFGNLIAPGSHHVAVDLSPPLSPTASYPTASPSTLERLQPSTTASSKEIPPSIKP